MCYSAQNRFEVACLYFRRKKSSWQVRMREETAHIRLICRTHSITSDCIPRRKGIISLHHQRPKLVLCLLFRVLAMSPWMSLSCGLKEDRRVSKTWRFWWQEYIFKTEGDYTIWPQGHSTGRCGDVKLWINTMYEMLARARALNNLAVRAFFFFKIVTGIFTRPRMLQNSSDMSITRYMMLEGKAEFYIWHEWLRFKNRECSLWLCHW